MHSAISATPSPASLARALSSSNGSSTCFPFPRRILLPCENSDKIARAWPSAPRSVEVKASTTRQNRTGRHERDRKNFHFAVPSTPCNASQVLAGDGLQFSVRQSKLTAFSAFRQLPMDTAGAYRLIDEETGEDVIVWGGIDDATSPIPSQEAITWKPKDIHEQGRKIVAGSLDNFGKLKVPKIRALMKKSMQVGSESSHSSIKSSLGEALLDATDSADSYPDFARKAASLDPPSDRKMNDTPPTNVIRQTFRSRDTLRKDLGAGNANMPSLHVNSTFRRWKDTDSRQNFDASRKKHHGKLPYDSGFFSRKSFNDFGCSDSMIESLRKQSILRPSNIQAMAYSPVLKGKSVIIADQSGSGKTLAYLAPVVQRLREEELSGVGESLSKSPRVVILAPTAELASQVLQNCRLLAKCGVPFRSVVVTGGFRQKTQLDSLQQELDVLIATPGRFMFLLQEGYIQLNNLKCVVLDEVDILFGDEDFEPVLQSFIRSSPVTAQYLFITATLPLEIYRKIVEVFPDCEVVMGPGMHRTSSRLEEVLLDCSGAEGEEKNPETAFLNKKAALLNLVEEAPVPKTIIFCNKIETCRKVENALRRVDRQQTRLKILPFHAALAQEQRLSNMQEFLKSESNESMFLICTDRASRGIDFANVDHVLLFDFPRDPSEYVRRVGRTARGARGTGKAFVFVVGKQVSMAKRIIERNKKGHPLHDVPQAYELQNSML